MSLFVVIPKRKMLPLQENTTQPVPIIMPGLSGSSTPTPPMTLSNLLIDTDKNWQGHLIDGLAKAITNEGAARPYDLLAAPEFVVDGGGVAITTGEKGHIRLPFNGEILSVALGADQPGSIVIDIWKNTTANFPPTIADTITASAKPTLSNESASLDATLTGWTKTFSIGDWLAFNVDSAATVTRVTIVLFVRRT